MNKKCLSKRAFFLGLTLAILSACASQQQTVATPAYSSKATASTVGTTKREVEKVSADHSRWIGDKLKTGNYKHLIIDPVVMAPLPVGLSPEQQTRLDELLTAFNQILLAELSAKVSVVSAPGPDVARLQPTFTHVSSAMQGMKVYEVIPLAALLGGIKAATGTRDKEIELWLEAKVSDSISNELLATMARKGSSDQADRKQATLEDVREMLRDWATNSATSAAELFN